MQSTDLTNSANLLQLYDLMKSIIKIHKEKKPYKIHSFDNLPYTNLTQLLCQGTHRASKVFYGWQDAKLRNFSAGSIKNI